MATGYALVSEICLLMLGVLCGDEIEVSSLFGCVNVLTRSFALNVTM